MTLEELNQLASVIGEKLQMVKKEVLTIDEVAQYTGLKKSYLYKLTAARAIPHSKPCGKICFFRRTELEAWLLSNPVALNSELNSRVMEYCMTHKSLFKTTNTWNSK